MNLIWGIGSIPLVVFGLAGSVLPMVAAAVLLGAAIQGGMVIWGRLLQRRVPPHLLGRVSSLDFLLSGALMPLSIALAGPVSEQVGITTTFLVAGLVPPVLAVVAVLAARLPADEIAHPLHDGADRDKVIRWDITPPARPEMARNGHPQDPQDPQDPRTPAEPHEWQQSRAGHPVGVAGVAGDRDPHAGMTLAGDPQPESGISAGQQPSAGVAGVAGVGYGPTRDVYPPCRDCGDPVHPAVGEDLHPLCVDRYNKESA